MSTLQNCKLLSIPKIEDPRGNLSVIENNVIPFEIKRKEPNAQTISAI